MKQYTYKILYEVEQNHWWFVGRRNIFEAQLKRYISNSNNNILDLGCGTGLNLQMLSRYGKSIGIDISPEAIKFGRMRGLNNLCIADVSYLPFKHNSFNIITAFDILEHIENDFMVLKEAFRVLKKDGILLIMIPTFNFLWGIQDTVSLHKRRYNMEEIKNKLVTSKFHIDKIIYVNFFLFPAIFILRKLIKICGISIRSENLINSRYLNIILSKIFSSEAKLIRKMKFPFGVSIFCIARKRFD